MNWFSIALLTPEELFKEAFEIAQDYRWDTKNVLESLKQKQIPPGFAKEVGQTIALFLRKEIVSYVFLNVWSWKEQDQYESEMRAHARRLANLRYILARIYILKTPQKENS